ncbi:MAG: hypothetical protein ACRD96_02815, partial [Bryobacteraceae bacterium]
LFGFGWSVAWWYAAGIRILPESRRYALEFELFLFVAGVALLHRLSQSSNPLLRLRGAATAVVLSAFGLAQLWNYTTQGFARRNPIPKEQTIEHRLALRLAALAPRGRVFASGGLRFRLNSWLPVPQVGGSFESGLDNRLPLQLAFQVRTGVNSQPGRESLDAIAELKTLGVEYLVVHGPKSREHYRDFWNPKKFEGYLEVVHREEDDTIYRVPFTSYAHLARSEELPDWPRGSILPVLEPDAAASEDPARPKLRAEWRGPNSMVIEGPMRENMYVSVHVSDHSGWVALQDGIPIVHEPDWMGLMVLTPRPSAHSRIELRFDGTPEQRAFAALSVLVWLAAAIYLIRNLRWPTRVRPPSLTP